MIRWSDNFKIFKFFVLSCLKWWTNMIFLVKELLETQIWRIHWKTIDVFILLSLLPRIWSCFYFSLRNTTFSLFSTLLEKNFILNIITRKLNLVHFQNKLTNNLDWHIIQLYLRHICTLDLQKLWIDRLG